MLDRDQQCAQPVHAVRRLLAHTDGQSLCQCRADRRQAELSPCLDMVMALPANSMNLEDYGIAIGSLPTCRARLRRSRACGRGIGAPAVRHEKWPAQFRLPAAAATKAPESRSHLRNSPDPARQCLAMAPSSAGKAVAMIALSAMRGASRRISSARAASTSTPVTDPSFTTVRPPTINSRICLAVARSGQAAAASMSGAAGRRRSRPNRAAKIGRSAGADRAIVGVVGDREAAIGESPPAAVRSRFTATSKPLPT